MAHWPTLNRLAYENSQLPEVPRFRGEITAAILQTFARTHGAHKPKATKYDNDNWLIESSAPLPAHIGDKNSKLLPALLWCKLMQSVGYEVPIKTKAASNKPKPPPLINPTQEQAEKLQALWNKQAERTKYGKPSEIHAMPQAYYSANSGGSYSHFETITLDSHGLKIWNSGSDNANDKTVRVRVSHGGVSYSADRVIVIEDKKQKELPVDFILPTKEEAAA